MLAAHGSILSHQPYRPRRCADVPMYAIDDVSGLVRLAADRVRLLRSQPQIVRD